MKRPNKGGKRIVPQRGKQSSEPGETVGQPLYRMPMPDKVTTVTPVPLDDWQVEEAGPMMTPAEYKEYCEREGILHEDRPIIPAVEEFAKLARWVKVAFAARCARRILPAFRFFWPEVSPERLKVIEEAVSAAENAARVGQKGLIPATLLEAVAEASQAAASSSGGKAILAALEAARLANDPDSYSFPPSANGHADFHAAHLVFETATVATYKLITRVRRDFDRVKFVAREKKWTDDTPVPQEVFGSLWPRDVFTPEWSWPAPEPTAKPT